MLARPAGELLVERERRGRAGRVVRVARPEDRRARPSGRTRRDRAASRAPRAAAPSRTLGAGEERAALVHRVGGLRNRDERAARRAPPARTRRSPPSSRASARSRPPGRPRRRTAARSTPRPPRGTRAARPRAGTTTPRGCPATSASRMNAGVGSRGSPTPKSITSIPRAARLGAPVVEPGERVLLELREERRELASADAPARKRLERVVGPLELGDLDPLVGRVGVARRAGAEVERVEPARGEVGDVRPGLLRLDREPAGLAQPLDERRAERDVRRAARTAGSRARARRARASRASASSGVRVGRVAEVERRLDPAPGSRSSRCRSRRSG